MSDSHELESKPAHSKRIVRILTAIVAILAIGGASVFIIKQTGLFQKTELEILHDEQMKIMENWVNPVTTIPDPEPTPNEKPLAETPESLRNFIYIPDDHPEQIHGYDLFGQELDRQALWLTAREEFGLRAIDAGIGEQRPDGLPDDRVFRVYQSDARSEKTPGFITVFTQGEGKKARKVWVGPYYGNHDYYTEDSAKSLASVEARTFGRYKKCLEVSGFSAKPAKRSNAPLPPTVEAKLDQLDDTVLFSALRTLHAEEKQNGQSTALLGGLIRAYALLGVLTEHEWTLAPYAFRARSMLYAQRLVRLEPDAPESYWLRAYAAALGGLHVLALEDLDVAREKQKAQATPSVPPSWVEAVDAFVHFDLTKISEIATKNKSPLIRLFEYLVQEEPLNDATMFMQTNSFLVREPNCFRAQDALFRMPGPFVGQRTTMRALDTFNKHLAERVRKMDGLPVEAAALVKLKKLSPSEEAKLYKQLFAAGEVLVDKDEPSWAAVATSLRDTKFVAACARANFLAYAIHIPTQEEMKPLALALQSHPNLAVLLGYEINHFRDGPAFRKHIETLCDARLDERANWIKPWIYRIDFKLGGLVASNMKGSSSTFQDVVRRESIIVFKQQAGRELNFYANLSPHSTLSVSKYVTNPPSTRPRTSAYFRTLAGATPEELPEIEKHYSWSTLVLQGLAERFAKDGKKDESERCLLMLSERLSDPKAFRQIAENYYKQKKYDLWEQTLIKSLDLEDVGLQQAQSRVQLAEYYMSKNDYERAERFARDAAGTGAEWAVNCLAECLEGLNRFKEAEELYESNTQQYGNPFPWYFAGRRTGKMDLEKPQKLCKEIIERMGDEVPSSYQLTTARYYLLTGKLKLAKPLFAQYDQGLIRPLPMNGLIMSMIDLSLGSKDQAYEQLFKTASLSTGYCPGLASTLRKWVNENTLPDEALIALILKGMDEEERPDAEFFIGWFFSIRGNAERADIHWKVCAESPVGSRLLNTHAKAFRLDQRKK